jgi:GMC oxidoreductase
MGMPILDDVNGPMVPGAGYININIAAEGTRVSSVGAFLRPALSRPNLTLVLNTTLLKLNFKGSRCVGIKLMTDGTLKDVAASLYRALPAYQSDFFNTHGPLSFTTRVGRLLRDLSGMGVLRPDDRHS